ncbi:MAG: class I SAM-dependent methyltransferase [Bacteroidetes bacterium]|nr:class I SAM-dependent methyltransferase [Bacteroidota bacterium]
MKRLFLILKTIISNPKTLLRVLNPNDDEAKETVIKKYNLPNGLPIVLLQDFITNPEHQVSPYFFLEGGSLPTDLFLLAQLAQRPEVKTYFEIGTWRGESVMNVAPFVDKAFTMNLSNEELQRRGANPEYIRQSGMLLPKEQSKIIQLYGDSLHFDFSEWSRKCDLIFVDGDHHYSNVVSDSTNALAMRRDENSIIVWHDYGYSPEEIRWEILQAILDAVPANEHKHLYHVANTKCVIYTKKQLNAKYHPRPTKPESVFEIGLKIKKLHYDK